MLFGNGGDDVLAGGSGADILVGGAGRDVLSYAGSAAAVQVDLARLTAIGGDAEGDLFDGFEDVEGSVFADALAGDAGANRLFGGNGDDGRLGDRKSAVSGKGVYVRLDFGGRRSIKKKNRITV